MYRHLSALPARAAKPLSKFIAIRAATLTHYSPPPNMKKLILSALLVPMFAFAQETSPPAPGAPTLQMEASAKSQVPNDEMVATLAAEQTGANVGALNDAVMASLNRAVTEAKASSRVNVRLGAFSTNPNYEKGKPEGWRVRGELVLTSSDMKGLSVLVGKLGQTLQVTGVSFRLSDKAREAEEKVLLGQAAKTFKAKAAAAATAFDFSGYEVKTLSLSQSSPRPIYQPMGMMAMSMKGSESAAVPAEGGDTDVVVTVSGLVSLKK